jgi:GNAT superfamily N-acetyltransferase
LRALADSPDSFGETLAEAEARDEAWWGRLAETLTTRGPHVGFVAEVDDIAVGLVYGLADGQEGARVGGMWVDPGARRRGAGRALVQAVLDWAAAEGRTRVGLWAPADEPAALATYHAAGFVETGVRQVHRDGVVIVAMERLGQG